MTPKQLLSHLILRYNKNEMLNVLLQAWTQYRFLLQKEGSHFVSLIYLRNTVFELYVCTKT